MFLANMSLTQFLAVLAALWGGIVALYLLDRTRRRVIVATLRLWNVSEKLSHLKRRRWIREPWSLLLQLVSVLLLLSAVADLHWGPRPRTGSDHVILLDTSAWMAARGRSGSLLDEAKAAALAYVRTLPPLDRAMVVRADATATPATRFESDHLVLEQAIRRARAGATSLRLAEALRFAREAQRLEGRPVGEIVYAGAGRIPREDVAVATGGRLRVLPVSEPADNCGLRKISLRRPADDLEAWEIFVTVRNYGRTRREVPVILQFGGALIGARTLKLASGEEQSTTFRYRTRVGGWIDVRLPITDALAGDNQARVELPAQPAIRVLVYSADPNLLRPVLSASPNVDATYRDPKAYDPSAQASIVVLDRFAPATRPNVDTIWIEPPANSSPFTVASTVSDAHLQRWHGENPLGAGLGTADVKVDSTEVFSPQPGDLPIADCAAGPVILARSGAYKSVAFGFHPALTPMRFELATPLLFANILRWMVPEVFRQWELNGGTVGATTVALDPGIDPSAVRVLGEGGRPVPFTTESGSVRFFVSTPGTVRVLAGSRERIYSLTLPDVADTKWQVPRGVLRGIGRVAASSPPGQVWPALALAGALGLLLEWMLFGRGIAASRRARA